MVYKLIMKALFMLKIFLFVLMSNAYACPGCAGSMDNPKDSMLVWILVTFIALTYIPFYILYRTIIKNRHLSEQAEGTELAESKAQDEV